MEESITDPEGIIMLIVAVILDLTGFIIFILGTWFGIDDYGILDTIGATIFGIWMFIRYSSIGSKGGAKAKPKTEEELKDEEAELEDKAEEGQVIPAKEKNQNESGTKEEALKKDSTEPAKTEPVKSENGKPPEKGASNPATEGQKANSGNKAMQASAQAVSDALKSGDIKGLGKKALKSFLWTLIVEFVPFIGGVCFMWTALVLHEKTGWSIWKIFSTKPTAVKK